MKRLFKVFISTILFLFTFVIVSCSNNGNGANEDSTIKQEMNSEQSSVNDAENTSQSDKPLITIMFDGNGGTLVSGNEIQKVESALDIIPPEYIRNGYIFEGWNIEIDSIATDRIIKAEWSEIIKYNVVTFDSNGGTLMGEETQKVEDGRQISIPNDPIRVGYSFEGWYLGSEKWSFASNIVTIDLTLTAQWKINQYSITIKYNDGITEDKVITQDYNTTVEEIDNPTRVGYTFDRWSETIPATIPAENKTITAQWKINQYSITIKYNDGITKDKVITQDYNSTLIIDEPTRIGYSFENWSEDILNIPAENKTITAQWKINQYSITIKYNDGITEDEVITQDYNTTVEEIDNPTRVGYTFDRWSETIPTTIPAENKIVTAIWKCHVKYEISNGSAIVTGYNEKKSIIILSNYEGFKTICIKANAFLNCSSLTDIVIPDSLETIGDFAFCNCISLNSVVIPEKVTYIGKKAFYNCVSLKNVIVPNCATKIGLNAFGECNSIESISFPLLDKSITDLSYIFNKNNPSSSSPIPNALKKVIISKSKRINDFFFYYCTSLKEIELESGLLEVGDYAFYRCSSLSNIIIPNTVKTIGKNAFEGCGIQNISIPDSVESIGNYLFSGCDNIVYNIDGDCNYVGNEDNPYLMLVSVNDKAKKTYTINNFTKFICSYAFEYCSLLESIVIPMNVTTICSYAFYNNSKLANIGIPNNIINIDINAFSGCNNIVYNIDGDCNYIGNVDNPYLVLMSVNDKTKTLYNINDFTKIIYTAAFKDCSSLENIVIPNSVTNIGYYAFDGCSSLENIVIPNSVTNIGDCAFNNCSSLTSIVVPESVTNIGYSAFNGCSSLEYLTIPFISKIKTEISANNYVIKEYSWGYMFGISSFLGSYSIQQAISTITNYEADSISYSSVTFYIPVALKKIIISNGDYLHQINLLDE